jgi:hypothetical protein
MWAAFMYVCQQTVKITSPFKNTEIDIAFKTGNSVESKKKLHNTRVDIYGGSEDRR